MDALVGRPYFIAAVRQAWLTDPHRSAVDPAPLPEWSSMQNCALISRSTSDRQPTHPGVPWSLRLRSRTSDRKREWSGRRARARLGIARRDVPHEELAAGAAPLCG
jgi:hypothetical protein